MTLSDLRSFRGQRIIIAKHRLELCHPQIATFDRGTPSLWSIGIAQKALNSSIYQTMHGILAVSEHYAQVKINDSRTN
jgi:hypothetical protein